VTLGITHVVAVLFAFVMHRRFVFVFGVWGHVLRDLVRFESVYLTALGINAVALPVLVELGLHRIPARTDLLMVTEFGCDIIDYVHRAGSEPKVFLWHEVSADYAAHAVESACRKTGLANTGDRRFSVGYDTEVTPVSSISRSESCLLFGSMIRASTSWRNTSSPRAAASNPSGRRGRFAVLRRALVPYSPRDPHPSGDVPIIPITREGVLAYRIHLGWQRLKNTDRALPRRSGVVGRMPETSGFQADSGCIGLSCRAAEPGARGSCFHFAERARQVKGSDRR
jgi:hypothetical protein